MKKIEALIKRLLNERWGFWIGQWRFEFVGRRLVYIGKSGRCRNYLERGKR
jgi:hypothetical protein